MAKQAQSKVSGPALRGMPVKKILITAEKPQTTQKQQTAASKAAKQSRTAKTEGTTDFEVAVRKEISRRILEMQNHLTGKKPQKVKINAAAKAAAKQEEKRATPFLPVKNFRISSRFGEDRGNHRHSGIDLALPTGSQVRVCEDGTVTYAGWSNGYGYRVIVDHGNGKATTYNHLSDIGVEVGQKVTMGTQIARSGSTGNSTGPHLHFEVKINGQYVNPEEYYDFGNGIAIRSNGSGYTSKLSAAQKNRGSNSGGKSNAKVNSAVNKVSFSGVPKVTADALTMAKKMQNSAVFELPAVAAAATTYNNKNPLFDVVPYYRRIQRSR